MGRAPRFLPRATIALSALLASGLLTAQVEEPKIHECRDAAGNVTYQDDPCPEPAPAKSAAPAARPAPTKSAPPATEKRAPVAATPVPAPARALPRSREWSLAAPPGSAAGFDSPERTWRTFVAALGRGDSAAAAACLAPSALDALGGGEASLPLEALRATVGAFTRLVDEGDAGPFRSVRASRPNARPRWIFFERDDRGDWKIAGL